MASDDDDILEEAQEAFKLATDTEMDNRKAALEDLRFARLGEQWDIKDRQRRGQDRPALVVNKLPAFIRQVVNDARQNKPSIKVRPVDDVADVQTAAVMNGIIRNVETSSNADVAYDTAADCAVTMGFGYFRVDLDYSHDDTFDQDLLIKAVPNPFSVYGDPSSTAADSSDWNSAFVTEWMPTDIFKQRYPDADEVNWDDTGMAHMGPDWRSEEEVLLAEWWKREEITRNVLLLDIPGQAPLTLAEDVYKEQRDFLDMLGAKVSKSRKVRSYKVMHYLMTGADILEETEWPGRYIPVVPVYGEEVNVEGKRIFRSLIRDAKDPQRMVNYWRTTATELVALSPRAPWIGPEDAFNGEDSERWNTANTENHNFLSYKGNVAPERIPFAGMPAGAIQEAMNANDDIKAVIGLFDASLGAQGNETSGVAINARAREGDVSTFHFIDNLSRGIRCGGRVLIDLIPHVYTAGRIVRILGPEGQIATATLGNRSPPSPMAAIAPPPPMGGPPPGMSPGMPPDMPGMAPGGSPMPPSGLPLGPGGAPPAGLPPGTPPLQPDPSSPAPWPPKPPDGTTGIFDLSVGKYDLVVDVGPSYTTRRAEASDQMMKLIQAYPPVAPIIGDLIAKNLDWPGAQEIADRLKSMLPPQLQKGPDGQPIPIPPPPPSPEMQAVMAKGQREIMEAQMADKREQQRLLADNLTKLIVAKIQAGADIETARIKGGMDMHTTLADSLMQIFADAQMQQSQQLQPQAAGASSGPGAAMSSSSMAPGPGGNGSAVPMMPNGLPMQ
jgi:Phage P22-like portal protein